MSTVRALNAGAPGAGTTTNLMSGLAKAWANVNGAATPSVRSSSNVSSVTLFTTGSFTVNFASAMANANYLTHITTGDPSAVIAPFIEPARLATTNVRVAGSTTLGSGTFVNGAYYATSVLGDLA